MRLPFATFPLLHEPVWLLWLPLLAVGCAPTPRVTQVTEAQLPRGFDYKGKLVTAVRWPDSQGNQFCAVTVQGVSKATHDKDDGHRTRMYLHRYQVVADSLGEGWQRRLSSRFCQPASQTHAVQRTLQVTDLNHDGRGEVWLLYYRSCRPDGQQPSNPELLMYEHDQRFTAIGTMMGCTLDSAFLKGPKVFRRFATRLWRREAAINAAQKRAEVRKEAAADKKAAAGS